MSRVDKNVALLLALLIASIAPVAALQAQTDAITYTRMYADESLVTHFVDETIALEGAGDFRVSSFTAATSVGYFHAGPRTDQDWHPAPQRQWVFVLTGILEVEVQDGEVRRFPAGSILFVEDTKGKGQKTRVVGGEPVIAAWVPVDQE